MGSSYEIIVKVTVMIVLHKILMLDPIPEPLEGLSPAAYAGIAVLAILLTASVIVNVIQFILWRRLKSEIGRSCILAH